MLSLVDNFLNTITMYRLVLYYLIVLLIVAILFSLFDILPYNPAYLVFSALLILAVCWVVNTVCAKIFGATTNVESVYITALILALLIAPVAPVNYAGVGFLIFASASAMASKYILALGKKHIFNPAAFSVALAALVLGQSATWWVGGNLPLLPFVFLGGLLIVRKIRKFDLVLAFSAAALVTTLLTAYGNNYAHSIAETLLYSPFFFLAFVMLTEPLTMPPSRSLRMVYGAMVGFLFAPNIHLGSFYFAPELALLVGNAFSYIVSPKGRFMLQLVEKNKIATDTYEFVFAPDRRFTFIPGQYLEWTLPPHAADSRGNRRYFTIASSPTENTICLGVKVYESKSTFKQTLLALNTGDTISASNLAGDFVLPRDTKKKLVWIAGGIGITPFRAMAQYLLDTKEARPVVLFYSNKRFAEIAYKETFNRAEREIGMKTVYALTPLETRTHDVLASSQLASLTGLTNEPAPVAGTHAGFIDAALIMREVPDYRECLFYLSGPHGMVTAFEKILHDMNVPRRNIKVDYFPGFV